jgi:hypothetical protein
MQIRWRKPLVREEKEKRRLETGAGAVLHFERGVTASAPGEAQRAALDKNCISGANSCQEKWGPQGLTFMSQIKGKKSRAAVEAKREFAFC